MNTLHSFADPLPDRWRHMVDPSFAKDINPLFREKDRSSMRYRFDLWSHEDVRGSAAAILFVRWFGSGMAD